MAVMTSENYGVFSALTNLNNRLGNTQLPFRFAYYYFTYIIQTHYTYQMCIIIIAYNINNLALMYKSN